MIKKLQIFVITILMTAFVSGQSDISHSKPIHQIGIGLGGVYYQLKDDIVAPLRWDGLGFDGGLSYLLLGESGRHEVDLRFLYAALYNRYNHKNRAVELKLGYSYWHKIAGGESHRLLHLGGHIDWNYCLQYYDNWDDSHFYWLNAYELSPSIRWSNTLGGKHELAFSSRVSLIALVARPPKYRYYDTLKLNEIYSEPHENMRLTSLNEYVSVALSGHYLFRVKSKFCLGLECLLNYKTYSKPERITLITYTLQLTTSIALGKIQ